MEDRAGPAQSATDLAPPAATVDQREQQLPPYFVTADEAIGGTQQNAPRDGRLFDLHDVA